MEFLIDGQTVNILLCAVILLLVVMLVLSIRKQRVYLRRAEEEAVTEAVTRVANYEGIRRFFEKNINAENHKRYTAIYLGAELAALRVITEGNEIAKFLREMSEIIKAASQRCGIVARITDDGFCIVRCDESQDSTVEWVYTVIQQIEQKVPDWELSFTPRIYAGIYSIDEMDTEPRATFTKAYQAALSALRNSSKVGVATAEILENYYEKSELREEIDRAFENKEFEVYLQFFVDTKNGTICGAEALARWNHPTKGVLTPNRFIDLIEQEHKSAQLDYYMLERASELLEDVKRDKNSDFFISCNFSRNTMMMPDFSRRCTEIMERHDFDKSLLIFELTEYAEVEDLGTIYNNFSELKERYNIRLFIDDFGNGKADLSQIGIYQFDGLKIDKSLVDNIAYPAGRVIMKGIAEIAQVLGVTIIVEGVEYDEEIALIRQLGGMIVQGYYFYKPMPHLEARKVYLETNGKVSVKSS